MSERETRCGHCGDRVDPSDRNVVFAVQRGAVTIIQSSGLKGHGRYYHRTCLPFARDEEREARVGGPSEDPAEPDSGGANPT